MKPGNLSPAPRDTALLLKTANGWLNRAVFEIPDLLQTLIAAAATETDSAAAFRALA